LHREVVVIIIAVLRGLSGEREASFNVSSTSGEFYEFAIFLIGFGTMSTAHNAA
jgi:hypothetical protein